MHEICANEPRESKRASGGSVGVMCQSQQHECDECNRDLNADGILGCSKEVADFEGLFNPPKEQLDRPSTLVQVRDLLRACIQIVGEDAQNLSALDHDLNFAGQA